jgi:arginyl-tRNA synthetase
MKKNIQQLLNDLIRQSLKDLGLDISLPSDFTLEFSISSGFGDVSNNCALILAAILKKPPREIAQKIAESINRDIKKGALSDCVREAKAEGAGFINFYLDEKYFYSFLCGVISQKEDFARSDFGAGQKVLIEFVSANPTGPLSVAHARQAAVGDALANIMGYLGFKVRKEYYLNDEGNQINILGDSVRLRLEGLKGENIEFPENYYQGDYIIDMAREIKDKNLKVKNFSDYASDSILEVIRQELKDFGVSFDRWYSQKELNKSGKIQEALDFLKKKGSLYDKDRVVIKSDSSYTYLAPDIAYHRDKYGRGFKRLINLWGPDHHGYINRLKAAVAALGHDPKSLDIIIVQLASIFRQGKPMEMSTRKGQYITLREVLDEVGVDASRFFFIMRRTQSHLSFDLEQAKKQTPENPVYYIQYANARIRSIIRQSAPQVRIDKLDLSVLKEKEELELLRKLWQLQYILNVCYQTLDPYMMTVYLQEVAEVFHRFYDRHRVLGQDENLTCARLYLISATGTVLTLGLKLLGVSAPEKM